MSGKRILELDESSMGDIKSSGYTVVSTPGNPGKSYKVPFNGLSDVAFSGDYNDLNNKPSIPTEPPVKDVKVNGSSVVKSGIANVTIPTQTQVDWEQTDSTAVDFIKNNPVISNYVASSNTNVWKIAETSESGDGRTTFASLLITLTQVGTSPTSTTSNYRKQTILVEIFHRLYTNYALSARAVSLDGATMTDEISIQCVKNDSNATWYLVLKEKQDYFDLSNYVLQKYVSPTGSFNKFVTPESNQITPIGTWYVTPSLIAPNIGTSDHSIGSPTKPIYIDSDGSIKEGNELSNHNHGNGTTTGITSSGTMPGTIDPNKVLHGDGTWGSDELPAISLPTAGYYKISTSTASTGRLAGGPVFAISLRENGNRSHSGFIFVKGGDYTSYSTTQSSIVWEGYGKSKTVQTTLQVYCMTSNTGTYSENDTLTIYVIVGSGTSVNITLVHSTNTTLFKETVSEIPSSAVRIPQYELPYISASDGSSFAVGSSRQPVCINSNGQIVACTGINRPTDMYNNSTTPIYGWHIGTSDVNSGWKTVNFSAVVSIGDWTSIDTMTTSARAYGAININHRMNAATPSAAQESYSGRVHSFNTYSAADSYGWAVYAVRGSSSYKIDWYIGRHPSQTNTSIYYSYIAIFPMFNNGFTFDDALTRRTTALSTYLNYYTTVKMVGLSATTPSVGSGTRPVYVNNNGLVEASSSNVGSTVQPIYMSAGSLLVAPYPLGNGTVMGNVGKTSASTARGDTSNLYNTCITCNNGSKYFLNAMRFMQGAIYTFLVPNVNGKMASLVTSTKLTVYIVGKPTVTLDTNAELKLDESGGSATNHEIIIAYRIGAVLYIFFSY